MLTLNPCFANINKPLVTSGTRTLTIEQQCNPENSLRIIQNKTKSKLTVKIARLF